jgi:hypothetical protein
MQAHFRMSAPRLSSDFFAPASSGPRRMRALAAQPAPGDGGPPRPHGTPPCLLPLGGMPGARLCAFIGGKAGSGWRDGLGTGAIECGLSGSTTVLAEALLGRPRRCPHRWLTPPAGPAVSCSAPAPQGRHRARALLVVAHGPLHGRWAGRCALRRATPRLGPAVLALWEAALAQRPQADGVVGTVWTVRARPPAGEAAG